MNTFVERHATKIRGTLSCFDRVVITGTLPDIGRAGAMARYLTAQGTRLFDYPRWAEPLRDEIRADAEGVAQEHGLKIEFVPRKDAFRQHLAGGDPGVPHAPRRHRLRLPGPRHGKERAMRRWRLVAALGVALAGVLLGARAASAGHESLSALLPGSALEGSRLFAGKGCLSCHSVHGVGGTAGPDLGRGILNRPLLEIAAVTWNHAPGMEHVLHEKRLARPTFEPAEMASLLSFLYYLGSLDPPGDANRGAALFRDKGCQTCHTVGTDGGTVGPDLTRYGRYASPLFLTAALWNRGRAMAEAIEAQKVPRPTIQGNEVPDLLAFIRSVGGGTERVYAPPGRPKRGEALFRERRCMECHSVRGHGGKVGPDLAVVLRGSLMRIAGTMWNHGPRMWATMAERRIDVPSFTTEEMSDLISYLYFFQSTDPPGNARRGLVVYRDKRCGICHGPAGARPIAPPFAAVVEKLKTPLGVITAMWNHAGRMAEIMTAENVAWPVVKGGEMADLIAYLLEAHAERGQAPASKGATAPGASSESRVTAPAPAR